MFKERKTIYIIIGGGVLFIALLCGVLTVYGASFFEISAYPNALSIRGSKGFPPLTSQMSGRRWIVERNYFFTTKDSDQQVALWYQQEGWRDLTSVGQRWELVPAGTAVNIHHSAIIYSDFFQEVCQFEDTCIFVRTTISVELPQVWLFK